MDSAQGWLLPACVAFLTQKLPFNLVHAGGTVDSLTADYRPHAIALADDKGEALAPPPRFADLPYPVLTRVALHPQPAKAELPKQPSVRVVARAPEATAPWLNEHLVPHPEEGLLLYSTLALDASA